ncbi:MAG: ATP-binding cassette domain-containing protein [Maritimibacter sp.]
MAQVKQDSVRKVYPNGYEAVVPCSFDIPDGEFVVLVGPSGCGKSTLLRMIAGLEEVSEGTVSIGDRVVNNIDPADRDIAMVFQNYALYPHMTVRKNIGYGLKNRKTPADVIEAKVQEAAQMLNLTEYLDRKPSQLSGGQRQRVAMGRAIVRDPALFLFDEPLSNLDAKLRNQMRIEIKALQRRLGVTSVYVTHDQVEAMTMADRIIVLNGGRIEQIGTPTSDHCPACRAALRRVSQSARSSGRSSKIEGQTFSVHVLKDIPVEPGQHRVRFKEKRLCLFDHDTSARL